MYASFTEIPGSVGETESVVRVGAHCRLLYITLVNVDIR
jgi:hypothetical protein